MGVFMILAYVVGGVLALILGAILLFAGYIKYQRSKLSHIPTPKLPNTFKAFFLGHALSFIDHRKQVKNDEDPVLELYEQWYSELDNPSVFVLYMMHLNFIIVSDTELIKEVIMQVKNGKPTVLSDRGRWLYGERFSGNGLASIPDHDTWKPRRKVYEHSFNKSYLRSLLPSFNECTDKLLEGIRPLADGKTIVPMKEHLSNVTLDVISKVAFGSDFSEEWDDEKLGLKLSKGNGKLTFLITHTFKGIQRTMNGGPFFQYFHPTEVKGYQETVRALRMIGRDCIMKRIRAVEAGEPIPRDILSSILQVASTKETVDIEELVDDFVTFYVAGQETTGNLLAFTTILINQHPDVLSRLQAEVEEVLEGRTEVTSEDLDKLQYTEQVLMEALRMYPPAFGVVKESMKGGLQLGEYFIPEKNILFLNTALMCKLPQFFDDPDKFDPTRFNPENIQPSSFVFFPFGLGHRGCIGKHFAMMEAKLILARLVQTFQFTLPTDYKLILAQRLTVQSKDNIPCTVTLRT